MSVNFEYSFGVAVSTTMFAIFLARHIALTRRLICLTAFCLAPTLVLAADALRTLPRAEECIDVARLNSVSEAERAVLRIEWRAGLARAEESRLLNEMYERIERLQKTTNDIRVLMNAIPSPGERAVANNSPSGLGPSTRIPPVAAVPVRATVAPVLKTPTLEAASVPTPAPPVAPVAVSPQTPAPTKTTPAPQVPVPAPWAKTLETSPNPEPPKSPVVIAIPEIPAVKMNPIGFGQLLGVGLVSVALVVLWWLRRRDDPPRRWGEAKAPDTVPHATVRASPVATTQAPPEMKIAVSEAPAAALIDVPVLKSADGFPVAPNFTPIVTPPLPMATPPPVAADDTDEHDKTLIIHAYQPPSAIELPSETVAESVKLGTSNTQQASIETPVKSVPPPLASPPSPAAPLQAGVQNTPVALKPDAQPQSEASILELAEMMLSMGLATGAAQKLVEHIRANPKSALAHWLKLLEIYRENGQRSNFEQAARQLQQEFNIRASDWMRGTTDRPRLEKFDRVFSQIESLWNQPAQCIAFLSGMLHDNRDGQRVGFPQEVAEEILLLIDILKETSGLSDIDAQV